MALEAKLKMLSPQMLADLTATDADCFLGGHAEYFYAVVLKVAGKRAPTTSLNALHGGK